MRKVLTPVFTLAFLGAALWAGWWFLGASRTEAALSDWLSDRRTDGWVAEADSIDTHGFATRFDTTITGLELADPDTGLAWQAPMFQILSLAYKPHQVIAVWPGEQLIATPGEKVTLAAETFHGSLFFLPDPALPLDRATIELAEATALSSLGWTSALEQGQIAIRRSPDAQAPNSYDLSVTVAGFTPASGLVERLSARTTLPDVFDGLTLTATASFDAPWDRFAIERARPQVTEIELDLLQATWGTLDLRMAGAVTVDTQGRPEGEITVKATNWREMVEIARASGAIPDDLVGTVTGALNFLAGLSGNPETLDVPLRLSGGLIFLGPIPIGNAPNLRLP